MQLNIRPFLRLKDFSSLMLSQTRGLCSKERSNGVLHRAGTPCSDRSGIAKLFFLPLFLFLTLNLAAKDIPKPTDLLVNDYTGTLQRQEVVKLGRKLRDYVGETSTQIVVVIENSTEDEEIFPYSNRLAREWGIGGGENDNGILIYVAIQDRKIQIQTGYGAEAFLTDALSRRIIENIIAPSFRKGKYYVGLDRATSTIMDLGKGEYKGDGLNGPRDAEGGIPFILIILALIVLIIILSRFSNDEDDDGGYYGGGRYDTDSRRTRRRRGGGGGWIFFPGGGFGGGSSNGGFGGGGSDGWGGFGGGGFGGFGGGDFGGGGAGGSW